jgi:hypothetical protein
MLHSGYSLAQGGGVVVSMGQEPDGRGTGTGAGDGVGDALCVPLIFGPVGNVDLVVEAVVSIREGDVFVDAAGPDVAFVSYLGAAKPGGGGPVDGADVKIVAVGTTQIAEGGPPRGRGRAAVSLARALRCARALQVHLPLRLDDLLEGRRRLREAAPAV